MLKCKQIGLRSLRNFGKMAKEIKSMTFTVVRHGETEANKERRLQGQIDTKLNEVGEKQATLAGKVLKDVKFDVAYSSDLQRAKKTCQLILEQNGPSNVGDIHEDPRIKERSFGDYENQPVNEFENKAKEAGFSRWIDYVPENGESRDDVRNRAKKFINDVVTKHSTSEQEIPSILIVTHGGLIREFNQILFDEMGCALPPNAQPGDHKKLARNTSWSKFELEINDSTIKSLKCTDLCNADHLKELD